MSTQSQTAAVATRAEEKTVEFIPFGAKDSIRLSASMVRSFIAVATRSGALPTERDCIRFIMLCRGKRANPFEGDCFLIGYDTQNGPSFSLVCGIELFLKRAEASTDYDGMESGAIVERAGQVLEVPGAFILSGDKLLGGWAKVYRKGRRIPEYKTVKLDVYDTGRSRWQKDAPGMIAKVAGSQALRAAYPTALGGLYTQEEMERVTETGGNLVEARPQIAMPTVKTVAEAEPDPEQPQPDREEPPHTVDEPSADAAMTRAEALNIIKAAPKGPQKRALAKRDLTPTDFEAASDIILAEVAQMLVKGEA